MRKKYGIPHMATVVGSFQKDGEGWKEGRSPKFIKGPDVFLDVVKILKRSFSDLLILLSGPARGFVKKGLENMRVPYKHVYLNHYPSIKELYQCLDLYLVTSREEGGPKAILESMASGVPLVTTRVGQAVDLVSHGENGWMVNVEDSEGLAYWAERALSQSDALEAVLENGIKTAMANTYDSQARLWKGFFQGFIRGL
jgi:glycosyltransferase involved in cell wall biosynthesis